MRPRPTAPVGLYDPAFEHDACGIGFVARLDGVPSHETVERGLPALANLEHRGAAGADAQTGDGAGILLQMPDRFVRAVVGDELPPPGSTGSGSASSRATTHDAPSWSGSSRRRSRPRGSACSPGGTSRSTTATSARAPTPTRRASGSSSSAPRPSSLPTEDAFERKLYVIRRVAELAAGPDLVLPSFSSRTLVYKGMLTAPQLPGYFPDLRDERVEAALVLVHSRFSTNTFPSWELAHPYRMICHNGEINTLRGNVNWMRARESQLASELFGDDLAKVLPVVRPGGSDTANFDNVLELLVLAGRSLPHAMMMMIPEAYQGRDDLSDELKGFYAYHQCLMEAWDGPAAIAFTDGRVVGATLDRNGLRPGPVARDEGRLGRARLGDGRARRAAGEHPAQGAPPAGQALPRRPRARPHRRGRGDQARGRDPQAVRAVVRAGGRPLLRPARARAARAAVRVAAPAPARLRLLAGGHEGDPRAARAQRRGGGRLDGQRLAARRPVRPQAAALLVLQAALRPGDEPAGRLDPRGGRDERAGERRLGAEPARRDARACPPARDRQPDPARLGARAPAPGRLGDLQGAHARHHLAGRGGPGGDGAGPRARVPGGGRRARRRRQHPDPLRPRGRAGAGARSRRRSRSPPSTTTSSARGRACRPA